MPSEPLTPEEIAQIRLRRSQRRCEPHRQGSSEYINAEVDLRRLLESHEALRREREWQGGWTRVTGEKSGWQVRAEKAEADLAVSGGEEE